MYRRGLRLDECDSGARVMVDHLAWAERYRDRAAECQSTAKHTSSISFGNCYRVLADHYILLSNLEEDFARRAATLQHAANQAMLATYQSK